MRIALFGGSFNPIHVGHLAIADAVVQQGLADEVWLMVSPQNPLKQQTDLAPEEVRLRWAQIAVAEGHSGVMACDYEFHLPRPSFTYLTLRRLRADFPQHEFMLCIGADNWECFSRWREPEEILAHHHIIVYPRIGCNCAIDNCSTSKDKGFTTISDSSDAESRVHMLNCPLINVSSTAIRHLLAHNESIEGLVPSSLIPTLKAAWKK